MLCDKHVVKMPLESAQMMSTVWHLNSESVPSDICKPTHAHHPCVKWAMQSTGNYAWLAKHATFLCMELRRRYGTVHARWQTILKLYEPPAGVPVGPRTCFAMAMPPRYHRDDPVQAYRDYYVAEKLRFAKWTNTVPPYWVPTDYWR